MNFIDFIRLDIEQLLQSEYPVYFYWDRMKSIDHPYVVYQTEDLELPHKLDTMYCRLLDNAITVYDYSSMNSIYRNFEFKPLLPNLDSIYCNNEKEIDILFYGLMTPRRQSIIQNLNLNVHCVDSLALNEMKLLISKSKWVLSIGSASNIHNDLLRVTPALNLGANIMLEHTQETWYDDYLQQHFKNRIQFI
jgi:hypothetical protein